MSTGVVDADSEVVAAAIVESDAATVGVAAGLAPADSLVSSGLAVAGARLPDGVAVGAVVGAVVGAEVAGGLDDALTVGVADPWPPPWPPPFP